MKSKKRKLENGHVLIEAGFRDEAEKKLSKEERREAKRLKKLKKEKRRLNKEESGGDLEKPEDDGDLSSGLIVKVGQHDDTIPEPTRKGTSEKSQSDHISENGNMNSERAKFLVGRSSKPIPKYIENPGRSSKSIPKNVEDPVRSQKSMPKYAEDPQLTSIPQKEIDNFLQTNAITIDNPSSSTLRPITQFSQLPKTFDSSPFAGFSAPTPIQSAAWPFLLNGQDVVGVAETGSGKTLAFGVPLIRSIISQSSSSHSKPSCRAIVVSPTRELAVQIHTQLESLAKAVSLQTVCVYGGVPKDAQRDALRTAHIVVATPGRLNDLIQEGSADLSNVRYLVLDEADRMLDKGFEDEIRKIISTTPSTDRQTLMFTATWPESVRKLASTFMKSPVHIFIGANNPTGELRANTRITQLVEVVDGMYKQTRLVQLLSQYHGKKNKDDRILIFCLYKKEAARIEDFLRRQGHSVAGIHGDMSQPARSASLEGFKSGKCTLLVATDVAARGLDIPAVKLVINVTFPLTVEDYVHRIGRTGRGGKDGLAITLFTDQDKPQAGGLINVLKAAKQNVPEELLKFGTTVKKKGHEAYGAFYKDMGPGEMKTATKIKF